MSFKPQGGVSAAQFATAMDTFTARCVATKTGTTAISGSLTVPFDAEVIDTDAMHDPVTNNTRITINTAGVYILGCNIGFSANILVEVKIRQDGTTDIATVRDGNANTEYCSLITQPIVCAANAYFEVVANGASGDIQSSSKFWAYRIA